MEPERKLWRHGFQLGTPVDEAIAAATQAFVDSYAAEGWEPVGDPEAEVISNAELDANNEFVVKIEGFFIKTS